jgi:4a-hydroxytetrahydrobiopterin dehydratase
MNGLSSQKCVPCKGDVDPISPAAIAEYMKQLVLPWELVDGKKIRHTFKFKTFLESMDFVNTIAAIAEEEGHHPDMHIYYNKVTIELWTHAIGGLFDNDFILAAKIEKIIDSK